MSASELFSRTPGQAALHLMDLVEKAVSAKSLGEFTERVLARIAETWHACSTFLCAPDLLLPKSQFFQVMVPSAGAVSISELGVRQLESFPCLDASPESVVPVLDTKVSPVGLLFYPLTVDASCVGLLWGRLHGGGNEA